jgi:hypothetical protein
MRRYWLLHLAASGSPKSLEAIGSASAPGAQMRQSVGMAVQKQPGPIQPEFEGLTSFERPRAERCYRRWLDHFQRKEPDKHEANRLRSLNLAHIGLAQIWLAIAGPIGFTATCLWSFHDSAC